MWIFDKIVTHNFGILKGTQETGFQEKEIVGIRAEYAEDSSRSNRGGKTTFIEAMRYVIDGSCRAKKEIQMIHHGEKVMWVEAHLLNYETGDRRVIKRGRDHKNVGILNVDWIDKTADAQAEIDDLLGIDKDFELTNFFKQSDIHGFMEKDPAEKGALLTKWITKGHWKGMEQKAIADRDAVKAKLKDNDATKKALESIMEITEPLEEELKVVGSERETLGEEHAALVKVRAKAFQEYDRVKKIKQGAADKIEVLNSEYKKIQEELQTKERRGNRYVELRTWLAANSKYAGEYDNVKMLELEESLEELRATIHSRKDALTKMKAVKTPMCPILMESCDRIEFSTNDIKSLEDKIVGLNKKLNDKNELLNTMCETENHHGEYTNNKREFDSLRELLKESKAQTLADENRTEVTELQTHLATDLKPVVEAIKAQDVEIKTMADSMAGADKRIGELEHRIKTSTEALSKIDEVAKRSEALRAELEDLNYIVFMFSRNGIPANEIENAFGDVQENINYILDGMECGFNINFSPDRELDKWEPVCHCGFVFPKGYRKTECEDCNSLRQKQRKSEITIEVTERGETQDFNLDSGGGKTLVSYAVRIGITMLKRDQNKNKLSVLFLDEVDSALDPYFVDQITSSITKVLTKKLGFRQIFMVSHKSKIRDAVPDILQVTRHAEGYSTVGWLN